jgi:hypothetical protein
MTIHEAPWPDGAVAWADLAVPDRHSAREFYGALLGWEFEEGEPETGYYSSATLDGHRVAGLGETMPGSEPAPSTWTTYLATSDIRAAADRVTAAGGQLLMPPMEIQDAGSFALAADATGAVVGLWQAGTHTGFDVVDVPGSVCWSEVLSGDAATSLAFYRALFPYEVEDMSAPGMTYSVLSLGADMVAGVGQHGDETPPGTRAYWSTYLGTADCDAAVAQLTELGGTVLSPPEDSPYGRLAQVTGRFGEAFFLITPADPG